ncbi:MAG: hypothetical protein JW809_16060 [Pirellulales bacterium]|nr:hypothetical protein [Pirellulales bacterium]
MTTFARLAALARIEWDSEAIRRSARHPTTFNARDWMIVIAIMAALLVGMMIWSWYVDRRNRSRPYNSPLWLFWTLCRAHRLRWSECWALWQLARHQGLDQPARLFLEPERFNTPNLTLALCQKGSPVDAIRFMLFADLRPNTAASSGPATAIPPPEPSAAAPSLATPRLDVPPWPGRPGARPRD